MQTVLEDIFTSGGYRFLNFGDPVVKIFYFYEQQRFRVIVTVSLDNFGMPNANEYQEIETKILNLFYHPDGKIVDLPEYLPIYHVDLLTVFLGKSDEKVKKICAEYPNAWGYFPDGNRLVIYENQPGDFFGLRDAIESADQMQGSGQIFAVGVKQRIWELVHPKNYIPAYSTILFALLNVLIFLILELIGDTRDPLFIETFGGLYPEDILVHGEWWRILTSCFLHFGASHLMNNMVIFCCVGSRLECVIGHWKFAVLFLLSGMGGSLLSCFAMVYSSEYAVSAGASGAVFGTIAGLLWAVIWNKGSLEGITTKGLFVMLGLSLYYGFSTIGVDNWGHIGGMLTGFLISVILYHEKD